MLLAGAPSVERLLEVNGMSGSTVPELTVCIPTYNAAHFLMEAIDSVMRQGLSDFEILIIDNASTDETSSLIESLKNPYIRFVRNEVNVGACGNHNICMDLATGRYVKFLCADDVLLDGVLNKQLNALKAHPEVSLVSCNLIVTDENLKETGGLRFFPGHAKGSRVIAACLGAVNNFIGGPSNVMFLRSASEDVRFDLKYRWLTDLKCWLEILQKGEYINIDEPGYLYRRHSSTDTLLSCPPEIHIGESLRLIEDFHNWNLLNSIQMLRRGGAEGRLAVRKNISQILRNFAPRTDSRAFLDILQWHRENVSSQ